MQSELRQGSPCVWVRNIEKVKNQRIHYLTKLTMLLVAHVSSRVAQSYDFRKVDL
jgi:hypothetical protein